MSPANTSAQSRYPAVLYRCFDAADRLLYIGVTSGMAARFRQHGKDSEWWGDVERVETVSFPQRHLAFDAERAAIVAEQPLHNRKRHFVNLHVPRIVDMDPKQAAS